MVSSALLLRRLFGVLTFRTCRPGDPKDTGECPTSVIRNNDVTKLGGCERGTRLLIVHGIVGILRDPVQRKYKGSLNNVDTSKKTFP